MLKHYSDDDAWIARCTAAGLDVDAMTEALIEECRVRVPPRLMLAVTRGITVKAKCDAKRRLTLKERGLPDGRGRRAQRASE